MSRVRPVSAKIESAAFGPLEVEALTSLTPEQARDWRRRGLLRGGGRGQPAYDVFDLAEISLRRGLNRLGIPLADTGPLMPDAVSFVVAEICRRTFWSEADVEDLVGEICNPLGENSLIVVSQGTDGCTETTFVSRRVLKSKITKSEFSYGPVWGIVNLKVVAGDIYIKSDRQLVGLVREVAR